MSDHDELGESYRRGGFGVRLGAGERPALLLIDLSNAYLDEESALFAGEGARRAVDSCRGLLETARSSERPVLHTRIELRHPADGGLFRRKVPGLEAFTVGNPLSEPPVGLEPREDEIVIVKQYASSFHGTSLSAALTSLGVDTLVIGGLSTSGCVRATAVDAIQHGFVPLVVSDACGDRHAAPHQAALFDLDAKYADVIGFDEAVEVLRGGRA